MTPRWPHARHTYAGNTYLAGDVNGDGVVDFQTRLDGLVDLTMADLVL
ncbi:MAG: hypothetical protein ACM308_01640 [Qipengyuania vulgaris]